MPRSIASARLSMSSEFVKYAIVSPSIDRSDAPGRHRLALRAGCKGRRRSFLREGVEDVVFATMKFDDGAIAAPTVARSV